MIENPRGEGANPYLNESLEQPVERFYQCVGFYGIAGVTTSFLDLNPSVDTCYSIFAFEILGFSLVFGCLVVKICRIVQFVRTKHNTRKYSDYLLLKLLAVATSFWIVILIIGRLFDLHKPIFLDFEIVAANGSDHKMFKCHMGTMDDIKNVFQGLMIIVSMYFMYQTKDIRPPFQEGAWTKRSVLAFSAAYSIEISRFYYFADVGIHSHLFLIVFSTYLAPSVALAFMLLPKLLYLGEEDRINSSVLSSSAQTIQVDPPEPIYIHRDSVVRPLE